jgi:hypothetical protein
MREGKGIHGFVEMLEGRRPSEKFRRGWK